MFNQRIFSSKGSLQWILIRSLSQCIVCTYTTRPINFSFNYYRPPYTDRALSHTRVFILMYYDSCADESPSSYSTTLLPKPPKRIGEMLVRFVLPSFRSHSLTTLTFHRSIKFFAWLKTWSYRRNLLYVSINQTISELKSDETTNKAASTQLHRRTEIVCGKDVSKRWFILTYYIAIMSKDGITTFRSHHNFSTRLMAKLLTRNNCNRPKLPKVGEMRCRNGHPLGFLCCDGEWEILWVFHKCCTSCRCWSVCTGYTSFAKSMGGSSERSWTAQSTLQAVYAYWIRYRCSQSGY